MVKAAKPTFEATRRRKAWNCASKSVREMVLWSPSFWTRDCNATVMGFSLFSANKLCTETYGQCVRDFVCIKLATISIVLTSWVTEWRRPLYGMLALNLSTISANDLFPGGFWRNRRWCDSVWQKWKLTIKHKEAKEKPIWLILRMCTGFIWFRNVCSGNYFVIFCKNLIWECCLCRKNLTENGLGITRTDFITTTVIR